MHTALDNYLRNNEKVYNVGLYVRLSRDDGKKYHEESESIKNQKDLLTRFVIDNNWNLVDIYCDDGYTGTNFNRPDFQRLLRDIENKRVNMVITKDLSRLGRDYISVGEYVEKYFPIKKVRYIAVNDQIDTSSDCIGNDMVGYRSIFNDMYPKDISRKVRSIFTSKRKNGEFIGAFAPYGYQKDPSNKSRLIIDEDTAPIIKRIFEMYIKGYGYRKIAKNLESDKILSPAEFKSSTTNYKNPKTKFGVWTDSTIRKILTNPTYMGSLAQNKYKITNYKLDKLEAIPRSEWIVVPNTHEAIISEADFELVQTIIQKHASTNSIQNKYTHLLTGLLFCGDCGQRMTYTRTPSGHFYVICSQYKRFSSCTRHSYSEEMLEQVIIKELKKISAQALDSGRLKKLADKSSISCKKNSGQEQIFKIENRLNEIRKVIKKLYEDKLKGVLSEEDFINLSQDYNRERGELNSKLDYLNKQQISQISDNPNFIFDKIKDIANFDTLDKAVMINFIDKIQVFENNVIKILYKFKKPY